ncbi:NAD(P)/FAD-dependent oxidoreductase [Aestuariispira insulae]|uniref:Glycine/D-amino acid oxidase-like deaminating enzyme n=1 Tax=Aestuariispira insulae TaxID=1461337 RepID=A0A3D9H1H8_9PROT|nr:FAD-binding oxidoreductase [Aestuariispira insulae]RED43377.1 glycine/D-amino acid oxidase-like deaminating enzyme [Aestuariispira insulae]
MQSQSGSFPAGQPLWSRTASAGAVLGRLQGEVAADVAIIGGGFTGLSAALHLAEAGRSVVLLEAADIGHGGSGRNVGLVNAGLWLMPDLVEQRLGPDAGRRLNELLAAAPDLVFSLIEKHAIECEATRCGTLHLGLGAKGQRELEARWSQMKRRGAPVHLLSAAETRVRTGTGRYGASILDERAGTIQPLGYARGLAHAARQAGAALYKESPVISLSRQQGRWHLKTDHGAVIADKVILATNAYGEPLVPGLQQSYLPVHFFQVASKPLGSEWRERILPGGQGCWDTRKVMVSFRLDQQGRLILGSIGGLSRLGRGSVKGWADKLASHLFPGIGPLEWQDMWDGRIAMTADSLPRFYQPEVGLYCAMGYNGRGIGPGTAFGRALAGHITDGTDFPLPLSEPASVPLRRFRAGTMESGLQMIQLFRRLTL